MKKNYLLFFIIAFYSVIGQAQVVVNLFPDLAKQFFIDNVWNTTIINPTASPINAYVQVSIKDKNNATVLDITTQVLSLQSGMNHLTSTEGISGRWAYGSNTISSILQQTGSLPFGTYMFCTTVYSPLNKILGSACEERDIAPLSPPLLSNPANTEVIEITNPVLIWIPPRPIMNIQVTYNLRLVQVQTGQSPAEALLQDAPLLNLSGLTTNTLNYPVDAQPLQVGQTYAWQVAATYEGYNLGTTDIWTFTVKVPEPPVSESIIYPVVSKKSDAKFYVTHGVFRFAYVNRANEKNLKYTIKQADNKGTLLSNLPVEALKPGTNKIQVDLSKNPGLKKDSFYTLEITDTKKQSYKLLYYYAAWESK
jgi:hypothetical protein